MSRFEDSGTDAVAGQRADCPHAPHDFSCGPLHSGICAFVHEGPCEAVHPVCPACYTAHPRVVVPSVISSVRRKGVRFMSCSTCEQRPFRYDADLVCAVCDWLVPDVNERLAERFAANGGPYAPDPGTCPGCHQKGRGIPVAFPIACPVCGAGQRIDQNGVSKDGLTMVWCDCRFSIKIPPSVWCPECRLNLRSLNKITALIKEANEPEVTVGDNVKEHPLDRAARRLIALAEDSKRRSARLSSQQRLLLLDVRHLDTLLFKEGSVDDWILSQVRLRSLGHRLHRDGGFNLMQAVAERVSVLNPGMLRFIESTWDGIGDWMK